MLRPLSPWSCCDLDRWPLTLCPKMHQCWKFGEIQSSNFQDIALTRPKKCYLFSEAEKIWTPHRLHFPASFWIWGGGQQVNLGGECPLAQRRTAPDAMTWEFHTFNWHDMDHVVTQPSALQPGTCHQLLHKSCPNHSPASELCSAEPMTIIYLNKCTKLQFIHTLMATCSE